MRHRLFLYAGLLAALWAPLQGFGQVKDDSLRPLLEAALPTYDHATGKVAPEKYVFAAEAIEVGEEVALLLVVFTPTTPVGAHAEEPIGSALFALRRIAKSRPQVIARFEAAPLETRGSINVRFESLGDLGKGATSVGITIERREYAANQAETHAVTTVYAWDGKTIQPVAAFENIDISFFNICRSRSRGRFVLEVKHEGGVIPDAHFKQYRWDGAKYREERRRESCDNDRVVPEGIAWVAGSSGDWQDMDDDWSTAWVVGAGEKALGQRLMISFEDPIALKSIEITAVCHDSKDGKETRRLKKIELEFSDGKNETVMLKNTREPQSVAIQRTAKTDHLRIDVRELFEGNKTARVCADVGVKAR